jgi:hypothetical protein
VVLWRLVLTLVALLAVALSLLVLTLVAFLAVGLWRLVLTLVALSAVELVSMALSRLVITLVALLGVEPWLLLITLEALSAVELVRMALPTMVCSGMGSSLEAWKTAVLSDMVLWRLVLTLVVLLAVALSLLVITLVALLLGAVAAGDRVDGLIVCRAGIPGGGDGGVLRHGRRVDAIEDRDALGLGVMVGGAHVGGVPGCGAGAVGTTDVGGLGYAAGDCGIEENCDHNLESACGFDIKAIAMYALKSVHLSHQDAAGPVTNVICAESSDDSDGDLLHQLDAGYLAEQKNGNAPAWEPTAPPAGSVDARNSNRSVLHPSLTQANGDPIGELLEMNRSCPDNGRDLHRERNRLYQRRCRLKKRDNTSKQRCSLEPVSDEIRAKTLQRLQHALGPPGLDESVCVSCDRLVPRREVVRKEASDWKYMAKMRCSLGEVDPTLPQTLKDAYCAPGCTLPERHCCFTTKLS